MSMLCWDVEILFLPLMGCRDVVACSFLGTSVLAGPTQTWTMRALGSGRCLGLRKRRKRKQGQRHTDDASWGP